jgi:hypothetical protein
MDNDMKAKDLFEGKTDKRAAALQQIKSRFITERVEGFTDDRGQSHPPVSLDEATERWNRREADFVKALSEAPDDLFGPPSGETPPGAASTSQSRPMPRRPMPRRMGGPGDVDAPEEMDRVTGMGRERGPAGMFNPRELSQLKDLLIFIMATTFDSPTDLKIGQALMAGKELEEGQLQHIMDEARRSNVPDNFSPLLQKIHQKLSGGA